MSLLNKENSKISESVYILDLLENLDSSIHYVGSALQEYNAMERKLMKLEIKIAGQESNTVGKFFETEEGKLLFPGFIQYYVNKGYESAINTMLDSTRKVYTSSYPYEGSEISVDVDENNEVNFHLNPKLVKMNVMVKNIASPYEVLKSYKISALAEVCYNIGLSFYATECNMLCRTLMGCENLNKHKVEPYEVIRIGDRSIQFVIASDKFIDSHVKDEDFILNQGSADGTICNIPVYLNIGNNENVLAFYIGQGASIERLVKGDYVSVELVNEGITSNTNIKNIDLQSEYFTKIRIKRYAAFNIMNPGRIICVESTGKENV